mgnify:CR=1 FL=1
MHKEFNYILYLMHIQKSGGTSVGMCITNSGVKESSRGNMQWDIKDPTLPDPTVGELQWNEPGLYGIHNFYDLPYRYIVPVRDPVSRYISNIYQSLCAKYSHYKNYAKYLHHDANDHESGYTHGQPLDTEFWDELLINDNRRELDNIYIRSFLKKHNSNHLITLEDVDECIKLIDSDRNICFVFQNTFRDSFNRAMKFLELDVTWMDKHERRKVQYDYSKNIKTRHMDIIRSENLYDIHLYNYLATKFKD